MLVDNDLRLFLARVLGWTREGAVEHALRSVELAANCRVALVLCGAGDMVPTARALHRRTLGAERPFIVCDPRRGNAPASVRSPANYKRGLAAFAAAAGGSLCVRASRLPSDFSSLVALLRSIDDVRFIVCADEHDDANVLLARPAPINVPQLASRIDELPRIVDEYALDAIADLAAPGARFTDADRAWVVEHAATSLAEIETATLRLVAIRASRNISRAAARLGMAPVSLSRWLGRRQMPPRRSAT